MRRAWSAVLPLLGDRLSIRSEQRELGLVPGSGEAIPTEGVCSLPTQRGCSGGLFCVIFSADSKSGSVCMETRRGLKVGVWSKRKSWRVGDTRNQNSGPSLYTTGPSAAGVTRFTCRAQRWVHTQP